MHESLLLQVIESTGQRVGHIDKRRKGDFPMLSQELIQRTVPGAFKHHGNGFEQRYTVQFYDVSTVYTRPKVRQLEEIL